MCIFLVVEIILTYNALDNSLKPGCLTSSNTAVNTGVTHTASQLGMNKLGFDGYNWIQHAYCSVVCHTINDISKDVTLVVHFSIPSPGSDHHTTCVLNAFHNRVIAVWFQ